MTVLLITSVFPPQVGGSGKWLYEVYRRLPGERVVVAAGEYAGAEAFDRAEEMRISRVPLEFDTWGLFEARGLSQYWRAFSRLMLLARAENASAVHCGKVLPEGWLAWMLKLRLGLPYWVFVHGEELHLGNQGRQLGWMMRRVFRGAEGVIANSRNTAAILQEQWKLPAGKVHVAHPGVDAEEFVPADDDEGFREQAGWQGRRVVLTVGRLQKRKGQDMLLKALPEIKRRVPDVLYVIVGDGDERQPLEQRVRTQGLSEHVQFLGEAANEVLLNCYQQCDLFALPNREVNGDFEGFGMVLVEAQACGKPVIAGASGGTSETMRVGETGLIIQCDSPQPLAQAIGDLLLDPDRRAAMGRAGRQWIESQFDWPRLAEQVGRILGFAEDSPSAADPLDKTTAIHFRKTAASL